MRDAIDQYYADKGKYPGRPAGARHRQYMREVPVDPISRSRDTWQTIPAEPDPAEPHRRSRHLQREERRRGHLAPGRSLHRVLTARPWRTARRARGRRGLAVAGSARTARSLVYVDVSSAYIKRPHSSGVIGPKKTWRGQSRPAGRRRGLRRPLETRPSPGRTRAGRSPSGPARSGRCGPSAGRRGCGASPAGRGAGTARAGRRHQRAGRHAQGAGDVAQHLRHVHRAHCGSRPPSGDRAVRARRLTSASKIVVNSSGRRSRLSPVWPLMKRTVARARKLPERAVDVRRRQCPAPRGRCRRRTSKRTDWTGTLPGFCVTVDGEGDDRRRRGGRRRGRQRHQRCRGLHHDHGRSRAACRRWCPRPSRSPCRCRRCDRCAPPTVMLPKVWTRAVAEVDDDRPHASPARSRPRRP